MTTAPVATPEAVAKALRQAVALRRELRATVLFATAVRRLPPPAHLRDWYAALDDPTRRRLVIVGPRESAKTTAVLTWALRLLAIDRRTRIGIVSHTDVLARAFLAEIAHELEHNARLQRLVAAPFRPTSLQARWNAHELQLVQGVTGKDLNVWATGTGGQVSGRRCDVLICDDLEDRDAVRSASARAATRQWFFRELLPTLTPEGKAVYVCTRKHHDDLASHLLRPGSGWEGLTRHARALTPEGESYWPDRWPREALLARKAELEATDVHAWAQEYLNEPALDELALFRPWAWPTFRDAPEEAEIVQAWDLAISTRETADWSCGVTVAVDATRRLYLLDVTRGHWDFHETQARIAEAAALWAPAVIGIEAVQYQAAAVQEALRRVAAPVVPLYPAQAALRAPGAAAALRIPRDKLSRARLAEARASAGLILRPDPAPPWWEAFARELAEFPAGAHDDQVDALAYACYLAQARQVSDWGGQVYGLVTCSACGQQAVPAPGRACPRCGTPLPDA